MSLKLSLIKFSLRRNRRKTAKFAVKAGAGKGQKFLIPRQDAPAVMTYLYRPNKSVGDPLPVVFNVHGGAWVGGDALMLDTQSQQMANRLGAMVVNINYTKVDERTFPYPQYEVRDTVKYFAAHAEEYGVDNKCFALMGYSAGGHLCACAAQLLKEESIALSCQVLCYPFLDFTYRDEAPEKAEELLEKLSIIDRMFFANLPKEHPLCSPARQETAKLAGLAPALIITCGNDPLKVQAECYAARLEKAGVSVRLLNNPDAIHGFLEVNFPETEANDAKSPEQKQLCTQCEADIAKHLHGFFQTKEFCYE